MSQPTRPRALPWVPIGIVAVLLLVGVVAALVLLNRRAPGPVGAPAPAPASASPASVASDEWQVAFTAPVSPPDNDPAKHHGSLDDKLVGLMNRATRTLDVADYDFDLANVAQAMAKAAQRGVRVRMVTDSDTLDNVKDAEVQAAFKTLRDASIPIVPDSRPPIMHDKFTVVDGEWVEMGSWNYTDGDTYHLNNNLAMNVRPKNYDWPAFYDRVVGLTGYSFSLPALWRRFRGTAGLVPRWMNLLRAVSSEGWGRFRYYRGIRRRLNTDRQFRAYFEQEFLVSGQRQELADAPVECEALAGCQVEVVLVGIDFVGQDGGDAR